MLYLFQKSIWLASPIRVIYHTLRGVMANLFSGDPTHDMIVIGVTGTKGKSTTVNLIARGLEQAGKKVAMYSTVNLDMVGEWSENTSKMTSPDPFVLGKFFAEAKRKWAEYAVIEVSSHAIFYNRIYGIDFDVAVFTNLSQDHLDLHGTMEEYAAVKLKLFTGLTYARRKKGIKKVSVVNMDNSWSGPFLQATVDTLFTFGNSPSAQIRALDVVNTSTGMKFTVKMPSHTFEVQTDMIGNFNVSNILAAIGVLISQRVDPKTIALAVAQFGRVAGRMEEISTNREARIFVDYAHTEESLKQVLLTLQWLAHTGRIITVFGATGDRDRTKRPKMGQIVHELSDVVLLTEDDNYGEEQFQIMNEVASGIPRKEGEDFWIIFHREDAIRTALLMAKKGDIILLAGKWSETSIVRSTGSEAWSDKLMVKKIAEEIERNRI